MGLSHYNEETGLITHFDGKDDGHVVGGFVLFLIFVFCSMIFSVVDEMWGPFDLPLILQYIKFVGNLALGVLFIIIKTVWEWWIEIRG